LELEEAGEERASMRVISLMYHDIVERGCEAASGFTGPDADIYKVERGRFEDHLRRIDESKCSAQGRVVDLHEQQPNAPPLLITFDDGGASAATLAAEMLEWHGWRGHFLVTAGRIGTAGFLDASQIRDLHQRGHVIGSHSYSHAMRMSRCSEAELREEWSRSVSVLSEIVGEPVTSASVCGGYYSRRVARTAAEAGIRFLFTSEPRTRTIRVDGCLVLGRFTIKHWMPGSMAAALARGDPAEALKQRALWEAKKISKIVGGRMYNRLRSAVLRGRN
jgi:peptidoglycan/xylan/chitin deacetylase (PgdA/CDA1 family)